MVDVFANIWLTRVDAFNVPAADFGLTDEHEYLRSVGEEPLRLMAYVAARNLPWSEIVTADYTLANATTYSMFELEWTEAAPESGWALARYTDRRPPNGVLATNGLWWRYATTLNNMNRGRAAAVSKLLLCHDFLQRPVVIQGLDEFTEEALLAATQEEPSCQSCHATLDPLAANFFGFWWYDVKDATELSSYHPEREPLGATYMDLTPAWFGQPLEGVAALGPVVAADPRFQRCIVEQMAEQLWHRPLTDADFNLLSASEEDFAAGGLRMGALLRSLMATPEYRAGALLEGADEDTDERYVTRRVMSVEQLASSVEALTGYRWSVQGYDQLTNDIVGYRVMGGGADGLIVTDPSPWPGVSRSLVIQRLAQLAAQAALEEDLARAAVDRRLVGTTAEDLLTLRPGDGRFEAEVEALRLRVHGLRPDADTLADDAALWTEVEALAGPQLAWQALVGGLLRDPLFWSY
jgi:hypothetical protein